MRTLSLFSKWCLLIMASVILAVGCSRKLAPEGHYQDTPVTVDGSANDWQLPLRFSNEHYTLQYNVTNDDNNIYVCVSTGEDAMQLRILRSGLTVWLDPKGENNKTIGLHFPLRKQPEPDQQRGRNADGGAFATAARSTDHSARKTELLSQSDYYGTEGFLEVENGQFSVSDAKSPIRVAITRNNRDSLLVYEAAIPIRNVLGADWKAHAKKKKFSVAIALNAIPASDDGGPMHSRRPSYGGMGINGMRGLGGMRGGGGGRRYGGGGAASQGQKEEASWYPFRLAVK